MYEIYSPFGWEKTDVPYEKLTQTLGQETKGSPNLVNTQPMDLYE